MNRIKVTYVQKYMTEIKHTVYLEFSDDVYREIKDNSSSGNIDSIENPFLTGELNCYIAERSKEIVDKYTEDNTDFEAEEI